MGELGLGGEEAPGPGRVGDWIHLFTGGRFWPLDPRPGEVDPRDIAHSLSMQCRYVGHTSRFYSVAEHCLLVAGALERDGHPDGTVLMGLLHDSAEAYLHDISRPLKRARFMTPYQQAEDKVLRAVFSRLGVASLDTPATYKAVKEYDDRILHDEAVTLMRVDVEPWHTQVGPPLGVHVAGIGPTEVEQLYLGKLQVLLGAEQWRSLITTW